MQLIIDGYNFIGRQGGLRGNIEAKRNRLVSDLGRYRQTKPHDVTVVFDGTRSGDSFGHEERVGGIAIVYSRHGETADEVIVRMAEEWGRDSIIVTSDRVVQQSCTASGALVLFSGEFESRLQAALSNAASGKTEDDGDRAPRSPSDKSGNPYRRPKKERQRAARIRAL